MDNITALEKKYELLLEEFGKQANFYVDEVQKLFPDMKKSSLYWNMSKLVEKGYITRVRNGVYTFNQWRDKKPIYLSESAVEIKEVLDETGFNY